MNVRAQQLLLLFFVQLLGSEKKGRLTFQYHFISDYCSFFCTYYILTCAKDAELKQSECYQIIIINNMKLIMTSNNKWLEKVQCV